MHTVDSTWTHTLSDPRNRNHKSLAIANHNSKSQAFPAEIAMKSQFYRCFRSRSDFFELRLQSLAICDSKSLRFGSLSSHPPSQNELIGKPQDMLQCLNTNLNLFFQDCVRGTGNGDEASKGSKGISGL